MKKEIFHLREPQAAPYLIETCEPLILWILRLNGEYLLMPELHFMIQTFYWEN
jgi:hypothetical protein